MDSPVLTIKDTQGNVQMSWDVWKAVEGTIIFGATGSGKTSSATTIALKMLTMGFGGLVLTAKPDEKNMWVEYCRHAGRLHDLVVIEPGGNYSFNFMQYEAADKSNSKSYTGNIVRVLKTVIQAGEEKTSGKSDDPFWEESLDMLLYNTIELNILAFGEVSVQDMYNIVLSAPRPDDEPDQDTDEDEDRGFAHAMRMADKNIRELIEQFDLSLSPEQKERLNTPALIDEAITEAIPEASRLKAVMQFFNQYYLNLNEKTRSIVDFSFTSFLFRLLKEPAYSLFCKRPSNITPEDCLEGKIVLINLPVKLYDKVGRDCQTMFKYIWQRAIERRNVNHNGRPVFLWSDEAQNFFHSYDTEFQTTARSSRVATVYMSQNLPTCYAFMGGTKYKDRINSLLGNLGTKLFYANSDVETNRYASDLIGQGYYREVSKSFTISGSYSSSESEAPKLRKMVRPEEFVQLKTGGEKNNRHVEAYMIVQGNGFLNGLNFRKVTFIQQQVTSPK